MSCTGQPITSASISCLNFNVLWDISGAQPTVTITNTSTITNNTNLKFWFYITSPSGVSIYGVDLNTLSVYPTPDVSGTAWTTKTFNLPTPFGNAPCGQVEFSPTNPYNITVFVTDNAASPVVLNSYTKPATIVRPSGNKNTTCGSFGMAAVSSQVDCLNKIIMCFNSTNLTYNNILTPLSTSNTWTLVYPQDPSGDIPNETATNTPSVNFPISINSDGYTMYLQQYATYDYGNGITVKVQYKLYNKDGGLGLTFAINCNTNLCILYCQMEKLRKLAYGSCGTLKNAALMDKLTILNALLSEILVGIFQPLCGINVPELIEEWKRIGKFDEGCDCCCGDNNFGFSNPTGGGSSSSGCCPVYKPVIDIGTGNPPINCPNGFYPADVYDPTGTSVIGIAYSASDVVNIINANAAWQAYGTAFVSGNCTVGFFPINGTNVPDPKVNPKGGGTGDGGYVVTVVDPHGDPVNCLATYFPAQVYDPTATTIIGVAYDINGLVSILNANSAWQAYGTAYVVDNCHVGWIPKPGGPPPPNVVVDPNGGSGSGCVDGMQTYNVTINDTCYPATTLITSASFPFNLYINFGLGAGTQFVANVTSQTDMIAALNTFSSKPGSVTFTAGPTVAQVIVNNTNCMSYSGAITVTTDASSSNYLLFAPNHFDMTSGSGNTGGNSQVYSMSVASLSVLGRIPGTGTTHGYWHVIQLSGYLLVTEPTTGHVYIYDVTNPLVPTLFLTIALNTVVGTNFTGNPHSETYASSLMSPPLSIESVYSLYLPTDYNGSLTSYVVESISGTIWRLGLTGVTGSFQDDRLIGKCPRVLINGLLYFTQDGDLESSSGQTSGVDIGDIVILNTATFSGSGLSTKTIFQNKVENVWAASYDGTGIIYFTGEKGSVGTLNVATNSVTNRYLYVAGVGLNMLSRANSVYYLGKLYVTPMHMDPFNGLIIDTATLGPTTTITHFQQPPANNMDGLFNFKPLNNCVGILTTVNFTGSPRAYVALYKLDGTYLSTIPQSDNNSYYNVIPILGNGNTTPNNYV